MALPFLFADNARSSLGAPLSLGGTTITLSSGGGALFPNPAPGQQFTLTLNDAATQAVFEVVWCTARSGDVLTVIRAQEGTTAKSWGSGDFCWNGPTAGTLNNVVQIPHMTDATIAPTFASTVVQGTLIATGALVGNSTGSFGSSVTAIDPGVANSGGVVVANSGANGARIRLQGTPGTSGTPNKTIQAVNGALAVQNSASNATIFSLSDVGDLSSVRSISATGSVSLNGSLTAGSSGTFTDTSNNGVVVNGTGSSGANIHLHAAGGDKYLRVLGNNFNIINNAYTQAIFTLDDVGSFAVTGNGSIAGGLNVSVVTAVNQITGLTLASTNGNVTANGGRLRASLGARNSGDGNAATLLGDFAFNPGGYVILPNSVIIQFGFAVLSGDPNVPEAFPIAFPNACLTVVCTEGAALGGWFINGVTPTIHAVSGFDTTTWRHAGVIWSESDGKVWEIKNLTTAWMAIGY